MLYCHTETSHGEGQESLWLFTERSKILSLGSHFSQLWLNFLIARTQDWTKKPLDTYWIPVPLWSFSVVFSVGLNPPVAFINSVLWADHCKVAPIISSTRTSGHWFVRFMKQSRSLLSSLRLSDTHWNRHDICICWAHSREATLMQQWNEI